MVHLEPSDVMAMLEWNYVIDAPSVNEGLPIAVKVLIFGEMVIDRICLGQIVHLFSSQCCTYVQSALPNIWSTMWKELICFILFFFFDSVLGDYIVS